MLDIPPLYHCLFNFECYLQVSTWSHFTCACSTNSSNLHCVSILHFTYNVFITINNSNNLFARYYVLCQSYANILLLKATVLNNASVLTAVTSVVKIFTLTSTLSSVRNVGYFDILSFKCAIYMYNNSEYTCYTYMYFAFTVKGRMISPSISYYKTNVSTLYYACL